MVKGEFEEVSEILEDLLQNLDKINHHGQRASSIVRGMLDHSRAGTGEKEPIDINVLADEYVRLAYHGFRAKDKSFNADFKTEFEENLPKIEVVAQEIGRVLLNLINNAFHAVKNVKNPVVVVSTKSENSRLIVTVMDNGPGIPAEIKDKIFQPFFTTKPSGQGTGLGLSLSYDIIKSYAGDIKVESKKAGGSAFVFELPLGNNLI